MTTHRFVLAVVLVSFPIAGIAAEDWNQYKYDSRHSGNAADRQVTTPLGLAGAAPLTDAVFTAPVVADGRVYVVDGSGVAFCFDAATLRELWRYQTAGGAVNCNNVSSPAVVEGCVHFGTMAGDYYVLDAQDGTVIRRIACGDPVMSAPVVGEGSVYFATLGSRVYALSPRGDVRWQWDYVREVLKFKGDRWSGQDWAAHKQGRVTWREQFCCSRNIALHENTLVVPAGGALIWLADAGDHGKLLAGYAPRESPATLGLSLGSDGTAYRQWYRRDNGGRVETLKLVDGDVEAGFVAGTESSWKGAQSMSFSSVSLRADDVYRTRPEAGFGFCRHNSSEPVRTLGGSPAIAAPVLVGDKAIYGGLDGRLVVASLDDADDIWSFSTAAGRPITAPAAVSDGRVYFGCDDGYLYCLAEDGDAPPPVRDLELWHVRSPLTGRFTAERFGWHTNFGNLANTNRADQSVELPLKMRWIRRFEGTVKHMSVSGGGRVYTHTAEGQIFAVEQETGRLLWRVFYPGVHVSYTAPVYHDETILVPQAGLAASRLRCLNAETGELVWEAPFTGSPSWNRQLPPIITGGLAVYPFSTGKYSPERWLFEHQSTFGFPADQRPIIKAWDVRTGEEAWSLDFSEHGAGGDDAGICLLDGTLYYSCYFGDKNPPGITAAIDPATGKLLWKTLKFSVHGGCTVSAADGRVYLGGYNPVDGRQNHVWCLDARDGSLIWKSDAVKRAIHVVTIGDGRLFAHSQYEHGYLLDSQSGQKTCDLVHGYNCTRFTMAGHHLLGANMDVYDTSRDNKLISTGPAVDVLLCTGAHVSHGRIHFTANGGGLQLSMSQGDEARRFTVPWQRP